MIASENNDVKKAEKSADDAAGVQNQIVLHTKGTKKRLLFVTLYMQNAYATIEITRESDGLLLEGMRKCRSEN